MDDLPESAPNPKFNAGYGTPPAQRQSVLNVLAIK
jgi:hypothetical protein